MVQQALYMQYYEVYLLFGSNLGERAANIANAVTLLEGSDIRVIKLSSLYETEPWGNKDQPKYINQAGKFNTTLPADQLLKTILETEQKMGRKRTEKWEPRIIDIDILFFDNQVIDEKDLKVPHPEIENRRFALIPLLEIAPGFEHPVLKKNVKELLDKCTDAMVVELFRH